MTLIIKELTINGIVTRDNSERKETPLFKEEIITYLEEMKNEITQECHELIQKKLDASTGR